MELVTYTSYIMLYHNLFFPSLKVISLPRVIRVADVASILGSNKHNGFPVSIDFSRTGLARDYLVLCADFFLHFDILLGNRPHEKW